MSYNLSIAVNFNQSPDSSADLIDEVRNYRTPSKYSDQQSSVPPQLYQDHEVCPQKRK